jgi:hypothetical protein
VLLRLSDRLHEVELLLIDPDNPNAHHWYDIHGNRHDWAQETMWDQEGSLIIGSAIDISDPQRSGLFRIQTDLYISTSFREENEIRREGMIDTEASMRSEYETKYEELVAQYSDFLGPPAFSGSETIKDGMKSEMDYPYNYVKNPHYPIEQWESPLTYWIHPEGRLQVGLHFGEGKGASIIITVACYRSE